MGEPGVTIVADTGPAVCVQVPVPTVAVLPAITALAGNPHLVRSGPALALVGAAANVITTSSCESAHGAPVTIVQRKVYAPSRVTVTPDAGELALVNDEVPGPLTCVQVPVPFVAVLPASVVVSVPHTPASGPALAVVGTAVTTPLAGTFCVVAPVEAQVILPEGEPTAEALNLT